MGSCCSRENTSTVTVKLILLDGRLKEFPQLVKVSRVLEENPGCFVCNSDEMEFGSVFSELDGEEELLPGQLYFALPKDSLNSLIRPAEMASLAVKASLALNMGGVVRCGCISRSKIDPLMALTPYERETKNDHISVEYGSSSRNSNGNGSGRRPSVGFGRASFSSNLSIILEESH